MKYKEFTARMVPTDDESQVANHNRLGLVTAKSQGWDAIVRRDYITPFYLYILSDDTIKHGDWCYDQRPNEEGVMVDLVYQKIVSPQHLDTSTERKIVASNNEALGVPTLTYDSLERFCKANGPEKIYLEWKYEPSRAYGISGDWTTREINELKLIDGVARLVIHPLHDKEWSYSDMVKLMQMYGNYVSNKVAESAKPDYVSAQEYLERGLYK